MQRQHRANTTLGDGWGIRPILRHVLGEVKRTYPSLSVTLLHLSAPYLAVARRRLARWSRVDSLQSGDVPDYDALLEYFPLAFHKPY